MTLGELVSHAERQLHRSPHPERARRDAETLLLYALSQNRAWLLAHWEDEAEQADQKNYGTAVARRLTGEPLQYIIGQAEFFGLPFSVASDVLIPRPETEHLVEEVLRLAASFPNPQIADIGTGSGAIAVSVARHIPQAQITAVDLSPAALVIARRNAEINQVTDRIDFLEGDLFAPLGNVCHPERSEGSVSVTTAGQRYNIIASNPPYVPLADRNSLSVEVRDHEPHAALFAGPDGLAIYRRLIPEALQYLVPNGWLVLEIGHGQQPVIQDLLTANDYRDVHFIPDYQGIPRVAVARKI